METQAWLNAWPVLLILGVPVALWLSMRADIKFRRRLASRNSLSDEEFVKQYYANSRVPPTIPLRLRPIYGKYFEIDPTKIHPDELPPDIHEFDTAPLVDAIEREFGIKISDDELERTTGEFGSIVQLIEKLKSSADPTMTRSHNL
jgi:acyl carrier protein